MRIRTAFIVAIGLAHISAFAAGETAPATLLDELRAEAGIPLSAIRGRQFFLQKSSDWSCSTCHTVDPRSQGRHAVTGMGISPLAPSANPQRFTNRAKVDKWFRRNCRDVLGRECSAREKGDLLAWLLSLR